MVILGIVQYDQHLSVVTSVLKELHQELLESSGIERLLGSLRD
jgi:hypothetical protein